MKVNAQQILDIVKQAYSPEKTKNFIQLYEGDGLEILPESKEFNFRCCNCEYIHKVKIEHKNDSVILRFYEYETD